MRLFLLLASSVLLLLLHGAVAQPDVYYCDPSLCQLPGCYCATVEPNQAKGISRSNAPLLVSITFDDAVTESTYAMQSAVLYNSGAVDAMGCKPRGTFYVTAANTHLHIAQRLFSEGQEIALHTVSHTTDNRTTIERWRAELNGVRDYLTTYGGIPQSSIRGSRAPFLLYNTPYHQVLSEQGLWYDSSQPEDYGEAYQSTLPNDLLYPYTMQAGSATACGRAEEGACPTAGVPGLWQLIMHSLWDTANGYSVAVMDPPGTAADNLALLKDNFQQHYQGSRAPFTINIHAPWMAENNRVAMLQEFFRYASSFPDVYFVTMAQIIQYMRDPVPSAQLAAKTYMACPSRNDPWGPEVCDGIDNNQNGQIDEGVVTTCVYPEGSIMKCGATCPPYPTVCGDKLCQGTEVCGVCSDCGPCVTPWAATITYKQAPVDRWVGGGCADLVLNNPSLNNNARYWRVTFTLAPGYTFSAVTNGGSATVKGQQGVIKPEIYNPYIDAGNSSSSKGNPRICVLTNGDNSASSFFTSIYATLYSQHCDINGGCSNVCGDGVCSPPTESATGCPFDCAVPWTNPPTVSCPAEQISADVTTFSWIVTGADGLTGAAMTPTCTPASPYTMTNQGKTTVTCSVTDSAMNSASCKFNLTVIGDIIPPVLTVANKVADALPGTAAAPVTWTVTATDNKDPNPVIACTPASGSSFPVGVTTVQCTATDFHGNVGTASFTVTVRDTQPPIVNCPASWTKQPDLTQQASLFAWTISATDNYNIPGALTNLVCNVTSPFAFPEGRTTAVRCQATDTSGNVGFCVWTGTVNAVAKPTLTCPTSITIPVNNVQTSSTFVWSSTAVSFSNAPLPVTCTPPSPKTLPEGSSMSVSCSATDPAGRTSTCNFPISAPVGDHTAPTVICPANMVLNTDLNSATKAGVTWIVPNATDSVTPNLVVTCSVAQGSSLPIGVHTVNCAATDAGDNTGRCSFTITVNDVQPPTMVCPANKNAVLVGQTNRFDYNFYADLVATDNSGAVIKPECTPSVTLFPKGVTTVSCSGTDPAMNKGTCTFTATIVDQTPPRMDCPPNLVKIADPTKSTTTVNWLTRASDNVDLKTTVACTPAPPSEFATGGPTTVSCTTADASGNNAACSFSVTVVSGAMCGNGACEPLQGETCTTCAKDCGACNTCGNGVCGGAETCDSCPDDCGQCGGIQLSVTAILQFSLIEMPTSALGQKMFMDGLQTDLSNALGVEPGRIVPQDFKPAAAPLTFTMSVLILPPLNGDAVPSAASVFDKLQQLIALPTGSAAVYQGSYAYYVVPNQKPDSSTTKMEYCDTQWQERCDKSTFPWATYGMYAGIGIGGVILLLILHRLYVRRRMQKNIDGYLKRSKSDNQLGADEKTKGQLAGSPSTKRLIDINYRSPRSLEKDSSQPADDKELNAVVLEGFSVPSAAVLEAKAGRRGKTPRAEAHDVQSSEQQQPQDNGSAEARPATRQNTARSRVADENVGSEQNEAAPVRRASRASARGRMEDGEAADEEQGMAAMTNNSASRASRPNTSRSRAGGDNSGDGASSGTARRPKSRTGDSAGGAKSSRSRPGTAQGQRSARPVWDV